MVATGVSETFDSAVTHGSKEEGWSRVAATSNEAAPTTSGGNTQIAMLVWALSKMRNSESSLHGTANHTQLISARCNRVGVDNMGRERVCRLQNHMLGHTYLMLATCASSSPLITTGNQLATKVQGDTVEMKVNKLINC